MFCKMTTVPLVSVSNRVHGVATHKDSTPDVHKHHPTWTHLHAV